MTATTLLASLCIALPGHVQPDAVEDLVQPDWRIVQGGDEARYGYEPMKYSTDIWYESTFWTGPDWTRVGRDWQHSGSTVNSVRVFNAPQPGQARVTGRCYKGDTKGGDGVVVAVRHGSQTLWTAAIGAADAVGSEHEIDVELAHGDKLRFVVNKAEAISCDTTYWDPVITYAGGATYRASEGFGEKTGVWSYEMESDGSDTSGLAPGWSVEQWISPDASRGALLVARVGEAPEETIRLADLLPASAYRVSGAADSAVRTGDDLMRTGLSLALPYGENLVLSYEAARDAVGSAVPVAPRDLSATGGGVSWESSPDAKCHVVWRDGDVIGWTNGSEYEDVGLLPGHAARYAVQAQRGFVRSAPAPAAVARSADNRPEPALWELVEDDWARTDRIAEAAGYASVAEDQLRRATDLGAAAEGISRVRKAIESPDASRGALRQAYLEAHWLKRNALLADPLLDFGELLLTKRVPTEYSHLVMQYFGWRARPGGGVHVLEAPGQSLRTRNILAGQLEGGSVLAPKLSYDAQRIIFSYSSCTEDDPYFHIYEVGVDGSGLRQLTSGQYEDLMPAYLPDGGIIFTSTRRRGFSRCFGAQFGDRWHVYTLHRMDGDGGNLKTLSFHETNEWFPSVLDDGSVAYARWDYVDRHAVLHQNLWRTNPDGTGASVLWGNHTQVPHCSFEAQAIPGTGKIIATGAAHHSVTGGSIFIIDPNVDYDGHEAIERITPEVPFPEAESWPNSYYATPWPLSEDLYLVSFSHDRLIPEPEPNLPGALGVYVLDRWGNRELLIRDPDIGCTSPIPLAARPTPPVLPSILAENAPDEGEVVLLDVHRGLPAEYAGQVKVVKMDIDANPATPGKYGIRAIPTILAFKNGEVVEQLQGARPKADFEAQIKNLL